MEKLSLGVLLLICAVLIGCAQTSQPAQPPASSYPQPEHGGGDGGGGGAM